MTYQIDQSIKIEATNHTSYVSISNGTNFLVSISPKEKQILKSYFRKLDRPLIFKLFTFSVLCAEVIANSKPKHVEIDREYLNNEVVIKSYIKQIFSIWGKPIPTIIFAQIGRHSSAHINAYKAHRRNTKTHRITAKEVLILYNKVDK